MVKHLAYRVSLRNFVTTTILHTYQSDCRLINFKIYYWMKWDWMRLISFQLKPCICFSNEMEILLIYANRHQVIFYTFKFTLHDIHLNLCVFIIWKLYFVMILIFHRGIGFYEKLNFIIFFSIYTGHSKLKCAFSSHTLQRSDFQYLQLDGDKFTVSNKKIQKTLMKFSFVFL